MGDDNVEASLAHILMCAVAGRGISRMSGASYTHPGMHANFFIHGVLGFFNYQSGLLGTDIKPAYALSLKAARYLALPCLMADLRRSNATLSAVHVLSGVIPFAISLAGEDNLHLGNLMIACNILALCHYSFETGKEWGWYTAGAAVFAYILSPQMGPKVFFPVGLALMEYCAYRVYHSHYDPPDPPNRRR